MMTTCPKCSSTDIMGPLKPFVTPNPIWVQLTEPKENGALIRSRESTHLSLAICGNCGYAEHHVEDCAQLWKYWQEGYR